MTNPDLHDFILLSQLFGLSLEALLIKDLSQMGLKLVAPRLNGLKSFNLFVLKEINPLIIQNRMAASITNEDLLKEINVLDQMTTRLLQQSINRP